MKIESGNDSIVFMNIGSALVSVIGQKLFPRKPPLSGMYNVPPGLYSEQEGETSVHQGNIPLHINLHTPSIAIVLPPISSQACRISGLATRR